MSNHARMERQADAAVVTVIDPVAIAETFDEKDLLDVAEACLKRAGVTPRTLNVVRGLAGPEVVEAINHRANLRLSHDAFARALMNRGVL